MGLVLKSIPELELIMGMFPIPVPIPRKDRIITSLLCRRGCAVADAFLVADADLVGALVASHLALVDLALQVGIGSGQRVLPTLKLCREFRGHVQTCT